MKTKTLVLSFWLLSGWGVAFASQVYNPVINQIMAEGSKKQAERQKGMLVEEKALLQNFIPQEVRDNLAPESLASLNEKLDMCVRSFDIWIPVNYGQIAERLRSLKKLQDSFINEDKSTEETIAQLDIMYGSLDSWRGFFSQQMFANRTTQP